VNNKLKSGMVAIVGRSNVGKSTLINALTGRKTAIVTSKPQTTRHLIQGVYNDERGQIVFVDTPGFFMRAKDSLSKTMLERVAFAMQDVDALIYMVDPTRAIGEEERKISGLVRELKMPRLCVINKMDLPRPDRVYHPDYVDMCGEIAPILEISAHRETHLKSLVTDLFEHMPEGEPLYPDDAFVRDEKHWISELIREKAFNTFGDELPYGLHVRIDEIEDTKTMLSVHATILTNNQRHKGMIIGRGAKKLKEVGMSARKELEVAAQKKVFLDLSVSVDERWMDRYEN